MPQPDRRQPGQGQVASNGKPPITEATLAEFFSLQRLEAENRSKELDIRRREVDSSDKYAEKVLAAQVNDFASERTHRRGVLRDRMVFATIVVLILSLLMGYCMYLGKDALVQDLIKIFGSLIAGAIGGYGWARTHTPKPQQPDEQ